MTGRGIDQILPYPCNPRIFEPHVRDARKYVELAESGKRADTETRQLQLYLGACSRHPGGDGAAGEDNQPGDEHHHERGLLEGKMDQLPDASRITSPASPQPGSMSVRLPTTMSLTGDTQDLRRACNTWKRQRSGRRERGSR